MAGYGMTDPKAAAAINALASKNNAAAAAKPYVAPKPAVKTTAAPKLASPTAYGMNNTNAAAVINNRALSNNIAATSSGGYGMNNVAASNYINNLARTTTARSTPGTTTKNPTWAPISGPASYQLPANYDWGSLAGHFGLNNPNTPFEFSGGGSSSSGIGAPSSGGGGALGGLGAALGGGGMGGLGSMGGGMGGIGDALGGALGGGSGAGGGAPAEEKEKDKPIPQRHWAGSYDAAQQAALNNASSDFQRAKLKEGYDVTNIDKFKGMQGYDDLKGDRVKQAQQLAERQGGQYDTEGNYYSRDAAKDAIDADNKKRAQLDANTYETPKGAVPIAGNEGDQKPAGSTPATGSGSGSSAAAGGKAGSSNLDNDWLKKLAGMASSWFGGG